MVVAIMLRIVIVKRHIGLFRSAILVGVAWECRMFCHLVTAKCISIIFELCRWIIVRVVSPFDVKMRGKIQADTMYFCHFANRMRNFIHRPIVLLLRIPMANRLMTSNLLSM